MKAINVARVSTDEQKENSPDAQLFRMQNYCKSHNFEVLMEFNFVESAYKVKRDEFDKIIECINNSKEKIAVCFDKVDRLSRNIFDKRVSLLYEKAINNEIELHFVSDGQVINDKMNAGDKFAFGMKLGLSKYYSDAISDNVKRAFEQKRRNGEWTGPVCLGYLNVPSDEEKRLRKDIIIDPERGHLVKKMFELYATNQYSLETIRIEVTNMGLKTKLGNKLSKSGVENILKDSFYCGIAMSEKYGDYPHKYPCLITKELFNKCQEVRKKRNNNKYKSVSKDFIFKGLLKCQNCGCTITAETHENKPVYYSCTNGKGVCKRQYINEKELLKPVYEVLERFEAITDRIQQDFVDELRKNTENEIVFHKIQIERVREEWDKINKRKDKLLEVLLDGSITKETYDKKLQEIQDNIQLLDIEMSEYTKADTNYQTTVATLISISRRAKDIFEKSSDVAGKRAFLSSLLQNPTVNEKKLSFTIAFPYNLVLELAESPNWLAWRRKLRMTKWEEVFIYPSVSLQQIKLLLAIVN